MIQVCSMTAAVIQWLGRLPVSPVVMCLKSYGDESSVIVISAYAAIPATKGDTSLNSFVIVMGTYGAITASKSNRFLSS